MYRYEYMVYIESVLYTVGESAKSLPAKRELREFALRAIGALRTAPQCVLWGSQKGVAKLI